MKMAAQQPDFFLGISSSGNVLLYSVGFFISVALKKPWILQKAAIRQCEKSMEEKKWRKDAKKLYKKNLAS